MIATMAMHLTAKLTHGSAKLGLVQPVTSVCRAAFSSSAAAPQLRRRLLTSLSRTPQGAIRQRSSSQQQIRAMAGVTQPSDYAFDIYCKGTRCTCSVAVQISCHSRPQDTSIWRHEDKRSHMVMWLLMIQCSYISCTGDPEGDNPSLKGKLLDCERFSLMHQPITYRVHVVCWAQFAQLADCRWQSCVQLCSDMYVVQAALLVAMQAPSRSG